MRYRPILLAVLAAGAIAFAAATAPGAAHGASSAGQPIGVFINDQPQHYDAPPVMAKGRVMVPMRAIFEALGAQVKWHGQERMVTAARDGAQVRLIVDHPWAMVGGRQVMLDTPPRMRQSRVFVPLRFVSESLGAEVKWDGAGRRVMIHSKHVPMRPTRPPVTPPPMPGTPPADLPPPAVEEQRVAVALQEFTVGVTPNRVKAGNIRFHVLNKGVVSHGLAIEGLEARTRNLGRGHNATLTVTLEPGVYTLYCPVGNHRKTGMETRLVVE